LDEFISDRPVFGLERQLGARSSWLRLLEEAYRVTPRDVSPEQSDAAEDDAAPDESDESARPGSEIEGTGMQLTEQVRERELEEWIVKLEEGKRWLEAQVVAYRELAEKREGVIVELKEWNSTLQSTMSALGVEVRTHKTRADTLAEELLAAGNRVAQLQGGVDWLEVQCANWRDTAGSLQEQIKELNATLQQSDKAKAWLETQRGNWEATAKAYETAKDQIATELLRWKQIAEERAGNSATH